MGRIKYYNHSLIQLPFLKIDMKRIMGFAVITALLFACTPEENNSGRSDNGNNLAVQEKGISLSPTSATIKEGESISLTATITPDHAENKAISRSSSSDAVATVDARGRVIGVKAGSATITATAENSNRIQRQ